jgi:predicted Zn-dependent protease
MAVTRLAMAGFEPAAMARVLEQLEAYASWRHGEAVAPKSLFASHPRLAERIVAARDAAAAAGPGSTAPRAAWLAAIDGLVFGPDPDRGMVVGRRFVHPRLGLALTLPVGFDIVHDDDWLIARGPDDLVMLLETPWRDAGRSRSGAEGLAVHGVDAWTTLDGAPAQTRTVVLRAGDRAEFRLRFVTPGRFSASHRRAMAAVAASFRTLSYDEAAAFPKRVITVVPAPGPDAHASMQVSEAPERLFRVLNGIDADATVVAGQPVKIVRRVETVPPAQTTRRASKPSSS